MPTPAKRVTKIEIACRRRQGWPSYWVRVIIEGGGCRSRFEHGRMSDAQAQAKRLGREHDAPVEVTPL